MVYLIDVTMATHTYMFCNTH